MSTHLEDHSTIIDPGACWNVIERVAATPSLKRAARLREFLLYVAGQSIKQGRTDIHEQEIGETVFGRPHAYDTSQDNIVRVSATELRKRIDGYFAADGLAEPMIFEIPRGSYLPVFRMRESLAVQIPVATPAATPAPVESFVVHRPAHLWTITAVAVLLAVLCILLLKQNASLRRRVQLLEQQHSLVQVPPAPSTTLL